jgi:hypothetical protein
MTLTIEIERELEEQLRVEAARAGLDPDKYIINALEDRLRERATRQQGAPHLTHAESDLLQKINQGLPEHIWQRYNELIAKRRAESLTAEEQTELIGISDGIEQANAERMAHLGELARLRHAPLEHLMSELGIRAPSYV